MCYCLQTCEQLTLQLEMGATTAHKPRLNMFCPEISLLGGLCKISHLCATAYKLVNNWPCNWKWVPLPAHKPRLDMFCPEISLLGGLCKISHLCATAYKLVCVSTVGYHLLELEDEFIDACLSEHRWCGDGLRIGRILFVRSDYPFTDCSLGRAR